MVLSLAIHYLKRRVTWGSYRGNEMVLHKITKRRGLCGRYFINC